MAQENADFVGVQRIIDGVGCSGVCRSIGENIAFRIAGQLFRGVGFGQGCVGYFGPKNGFEMDDLRRSGIRMERWVWIQHNHSD